MQWFRIIALRSIRLLVSGFDSTVNVAVRRFNRGIFALIIELFALAKTNLHFDTAVFKIKRKRDQSQSLRFQQSEKLHDFPLVHEQASDTTRITVEQITFLIGGNVHITQKDFTVIDRAPAVFQIDIAAANRFDFCSDQFDAGFISFKNKVIMSCFAVFCDLFGTGLFDRTALLSEQELIIA